MWALQLFSFASKYLYTFPVQLSTIYFCSWSNRARFGMVRGSLCWYRRSLTMSLKYWEVKRFLHHLLSWKSPDVCHTFMLPLNYGLIFKCKGHWVRDSRKARCHAQKCLQCATWFYRFLSATDNFVVWSVDPQVYRSVEMWRICGVTVRKKSQTKCMEKCDYVGERWV